MYDYTTIEGQVLALREIQSLLSQYSAATGRPGFPDAILFDTLVEREADYGSGADDTIKSAEAAMRTILAANWGLSISGYFWDSISDQVTDILREHGLAEEAEVL